MWRSNQLSYRTGRETQDPLRYRRAPVHGCGGGREARPRLSLGAADGKRAAHISKPHLQEVTRGMTIPNLSTVLKDKSDPRSDNSRKEVFQPHLPVRLPCYDLAPITGFTLGRPSRSRTLGAPGFHGLTGGVYKARERIHRAMADARLLANPASWSRVADSDPN